jgi:hypothetical protein
MLCRLPSCTIDRTFSFIEEQTSQVFLLTLVRQSATKLKLNGKQSTSSLNASETLMTLLIPDFISTLGWKRSKSLLEQHTHALISTYLDITPKTPDDIDLFEPPMPTWSVEREAALTKLIKLYYESPILCVTGIAVERPTWFRN